MNNLLAFETAAQNRGIAIITQHLTKNQGISLEAMEEETLLYLEGPMLEYFLRNGGVADAKEVQERRDDWRLFIRRLNRQERLVAAQPIRYTIKGETK